MFLCTECSVPKTIWDAKAYLAHFQFYHSKLVALRSLKCCYSDCLGRKYDKWNSFSKHVMTHKLVRSKSVCVPTVSNNVPSSVSLSQDSVEGNCSVENDVHMNGSDGDDVSQEDLPNAPVNFNDEQSQSVNFDNALMNAVISFLANMYDSGHFNETQVQFIVDSHRQLLGSGFLSILKDKVEKMLLKSVECGAVDVHDVKNVSRMFDSCENMYDGFHSAHMRMSEFEKSGAYVPPESFYIGHGTNEKRENGVTVIEPIELIGQFIPFRHVLKGFLELPHVLNSILDYMSELEANVQDGGPMSNIIQGKLWRNVIKPKFEGKFVLPLIFSFDDYETNKELGFHTCIHKLGAGYIRIACLPPKFASLLENLFLVVLFHSNDRQAGNDKVFRKVIHELKYLEETGIPIVTCDRSLHVHFALSLVVGDNLGSNGILGFVECFVANFFCRICFEKRDNMITKCETNLAKMRTINSYERDLIINDVSKTGRKGPCFFNELNSFHVSVNKHLDTMHDRDEGIVKYTMFVVVQYFLQSKRCSLDYLNELIQSFYYGSEEKNKPSSISRDDIYKNKKLRFSASEMKCFATYFGLMFGHLVNPDEDGNVWGLYLSLRKFIDLLSAPILLASDGIRLKVLCKELCSKYREITGDTLPPKFHLSQHYGDLVEDNGPLEPLSCYRVEHKHKEGSDIAHASQNRINLPFTIAKAHQLKLAFRLLVGRGFVPKFSFSKVNSIPFESVQYYHNVYNIVPDSHKGLWHTCKWLEVNGARYELGSVVLHSIEGETPVFGDIRVISIREDKAFFILQCYNVVKFDKHYYAYEVNSCNKWLYIESDELLSHLSTNVRRLLNGKSYIPFRFSVKCFMK